MSHPPSTDSLIVTYPDRFGSERFRVVKHTWPRVDGEVVHVATIMAIDGFKLSVPYARLTPVNK